MNAIEIKNLKKSYKDLKVLTGINLSVEKGTIFALLGPNGAGKTTTVKILSTLLAPDSGQALVNGHDVVKEADKVRHSIGLTGQYAAVDEFLNGFENLQMMGRLYRLSSADSKKRALELLEEFDLTDAAYRAVKTYSGGMRRRLDLALSLIATPPIIFLDEPTTGLDPRSRLVVWNTVKKLAENGTTILLTTQYLDEADQLAQKIAVIDQGKVIAEGTADQLKKQIGHDRLTLTLSKVDDLEKAKKLIQKDGVLADKLQKTINVATENVKELQQILEKFEKASIKIADISIQKPTLDDVFLELTGHGTSQDEKGKK